MDRDGSNDSVWLVIPGGVDAWSWSASADTIGYITSDSRSVVTNFVDYSGDPVTETFDPEPAEPCHPFDTWCVGDMRLDPAGNGLVYAWVFNGMDEDSEIRVVNAAGEETARIVVPGLLGIFDFYDGMVLARVTGTGNDELALVDVRTETVTPITLPAEWGQPRSVHFNP